MRKILLVAVVFLQHAAMASLQVFPTRVILSDQTHVANVSLRHLGEKPGKYRIKAVFYRMKPDGSVELVDNPSDAERPFVKMLRFSPHSATLTPGTEQIVRAQFVGPKSLPEGEYRAHLQFEPADEPEDDASTSAPKDKVSMQLKAKVAIAVPVIYRQGAPKFEVQLSNLKLVKSEHGAAFSLDMAAKGTAFPFGDFHAFFVPKGGAPLAIGLVRSVASYLAKRTVSYSLTVPAGLKLSAGALRVEYREPEETGGKLFTAVETELR